MSTLIAVDTSVAVPLLAQSHTAHAEVVRWWANQDLALSGHAAIETYSVLTRLPGDAPLDPDDAGKLIVERFAPTLLLSNEAASLLPGLLTEKDIAGGAVYDAIVGMVAAEHHVELATRDARARGTYEKVGVRVVVAA